MQILITLFFLALLLTTGSIGFLYLRLRSQHTLLDKAHADLGSQYNAIKVDYERLQQAHTKLSEEFSVVTEIESLKRNRQVRPDQERPPLSTKVQQVLDKRGATGQTATKTATLGQEVFPSEERAVMDDIQAYLDRFHLQQATHNKQFSPRDPLPGHEIIDYMERSCVTLGATSVTGKRVHISVVCLEALRNGGWTTLATRARNAVDNMINEVRPPRHSDRVLVESNTIMLRGSKARFDEIGNPGG